MFPGLRTVTHPTIALSADLEGKSEKKRILDIYKRKAKEKKKKKTKKKKKKNIKRKRERDKNFCSLK